MIIISKQINIIGLKFGRLRVISKSDKRNKNKNAHWNCLCDCGNYVVVDGHNLRCGHTISCGCLQKENTSNSRKSSNYYDLSNEYGIGYTKNRKPFLFDKDDFEIINGYCWVCNDDGYIIAHSKDGNIRMHRLVMGVLRDNVIVDHINHNTSDNRKKNLRIANKQLNGINRGCNINNKLGHKGVHMSKNGKYIAKIMKDGTSIHIGCFDTLQEAIVARANKETELFGEFANVEETV